MTAIFKALICRTGCLFLLSILFLSGCSMHYYEPEFHYPEGQNSTKPFKGIAQHLNALMKRTGEKKSAVDIILFHGMGIYEKAWLDPKIIKTLLSEEWKEKEKQCFVVKENSNEGALKKVDCLNSENHEATDDNTKIDIKIETISFTRECKGRDQKICQEIRFHAVIWSRLTTPLKRKLCSDISEEDARVKLGCEQEYSYFRAKVNSWVKSGAINSGFSDVVIYFGENGKRIREAFRSSIEQILNGKNGKNGGNDQTNASLVIITSSLASHILIESLSEAKKAKDETKDAAKKAANAAEKAATVAEEAQARAEEAQAEAEEAKIAAEVAVAVAIEAAVAAEAAAGVAKETAVAAEEAVGVAREATDTAKKAAGVAEKTLAIAERAKVEETGVVAKETAVAAEAAKAGAEKAQAGAEEAADAAEKAQAGADEAATGAEKAQAGAEEAKIAAEVAAAVAIETAVAAEEAAGVAKEAAVAAKKAVNAAEKAAGVAREAAEPLGQLEAQLKFMAPKEIPISIFMAANQIPLLELAQEADFSVFQRLIEKGNQDLNIEVVAFTDPNDVLSYEMKKLDKATVTNVIISNTMSFLGLFELSTPMPFTTWSFGWPFVKAHEHYLENDRVWKLILCGRSEDCAALQ